MATGGAIDRFKASVLRTGLARAARYEVVIHPPALLTQLYGDISNLTRNVGISCNTIAMPGHDLQTQKVQYGSAPAREMVTSHAFEGKIDGTFYMDTEMKTKMFFDAWQQLAVNPATHKANYYKDYIGSMEIYQLGSMPTTVESRETAVVAGGRIIHKDRSRVEGPRNEHGEQVLHNVTKRAYGIRVEEVYPETIGSIEYAYETVDALALLPIGFQYRRWKTIDPTKLEG